LLLSIHGVVRSIRNVLNTQKGIFNVAGITHYKPKGVDLKKETGRHPKIQAHVSRQPKFPLYMKTLLKCIEEDGLRTISIYCHKGRHRSVATAILLSEELFERGFSVKLIHLDS